MRLSDLRSAVMVGRSGKWSKSKRIGAKTAKNKNIIGPRLNEMSLGQMIIFLRRKSPLWIIRAVNFITTPVVAVGLLRTNLKGKMCKKCCFMHHFANLTDCKLDGLLINWSCFIYILSAAQDARYQIQ